MIKRSLQFLVLIAGCCLCSSYVPIRAKEIYRQSLPQDAIGNFWTWFEKHEKSLRDFQKDPGKILKEVLDQSNKIQNGLAIEFEPPKKNIIDVTVSANGNLNLFPLVEEIVRRAPRMQGWKFIAFRQRMTTAQVKDLSLNAQGLDLKPVNMKFFPVSSGDSLDVIVYVNGLTEENYQQIAYGGFLLLDNILGEYDCVMKVRHYDFQNMPTNPGELKDLQPLPDLPAYVDLFYKIQKKLLKDRH